MTTGFRDGACRGAESLDLDVFNLGFASVSLPLRLLGG